jgi:glucose-6-phosphate 1-dehydrogenase
LFTGSDEILETWRILDPLQKAWEEDDSNLIIYKKGSTIEEVLAEK